MIEEPYRWLEAIGNRREYVRDQLKGGSPVLAASRPDGILLVGVGSGQSKVFELFDRHALAGLGHPADIERIRQAAIDAAHLEAFNRAPEDVSLRRLVGFGLGPQLKAAFEEIFRAPFLIELILAELGAEPGRDVLVRLHFDGTFESRHGGVMVAAVDEERESKARAWLELSLASALGRAEAADLLLQAWWCLTSNASFDSVPPEAERQQGWRAAVRDRKVELGWLDRHATRPACYVASTLASLGL